LHSGKERRLEKLTKLLDKLRDEAAGGTPIIVEGRNDAKALEALGIRGNLIQAKSYRGSLLQLVEGLNVHAGVIILTDFDRRGEQLAKFMAESFERQRVKVNLVYRRRLAAIIKTDVKDLEGLAAYIGKKLG